MELNSFRLVNNGTVSVVINTLNEESNIAKCIGSILGFADEILICDMYSSDNTVRIARDLGARVIYHEKTSYVEPARYYAVNAASGEWVLILDADEQLTPGIRNELKTVVAEGKADLVRMGKLYYYFTRYIKHGGFYNKNYPLLFRKELYIKNYSHKNSGIFNGFTHLIDNAKEIRNIDKSYFILHNAYPSIEKYVVKTEGKYALIEAEAMQQEGKKFRLLMLLFDPLKTFIKKYFLQRGFVEGTNGFILCVLYSSYRFKVWANLWMLEKQNSGTEYQIPNN
jgi:glycosyltransferase involved in cell wall biosynthesis